MKRQFDLLYSYGSEFLPGDLIRNSFNNRPMKHFEIVRIYPEKDDKHTFYYCLYEYKWKGNVERKKFALLEDGRLQPILEYCFSHGISINNCALTAEFSAPSNRTIKVPAVFHVNIKDED